MFKPVLERSKLPLYSDFFPESNTHDLSGFFSKFLLAMSMTVETPVSEEQFIPIQMLVSIRTDRTNELIVPDDGKFYIECPTEYYTEHPLDDLVLLVAKRAVDEYFDCGEDLLKVIPRTVPYPVGACLRDDVIYVYVNLLVDHTLKSEEFFKLKGCHYEDFSSVTPANDLESELIGSLAIVVNTRNEEE